MSSEIATPNEIFLTSEEIENLVSIEKQQEEAEFSLTEAQITVATCDLAIKRLKSKRTAAGILAAKMHNIDVNSPTEKWTFTGTSFKREIK